jgi:hypothetical protein
MRTIVERVKAEIQTVVKRIRCDNAFDTRESQKLANKMGFMIELKPPHEMNYLSKVDRYIQTLEQTSRCLLLMAGLPHHFWGESMTTGCYILNRCITKGTPCRETPIQMLTGTAPNVSHMRTFGCEAWAKIPHTNKIEPTGGKCVLLGYNEKQNTYRLLSSKTMKTINRASVTFNEENVQAWKTIKNKSYPRRTEPREEDLGEDAHGYDPSEIHAEERAKERNPSKKTTEVKNPSKER